MDALPPLLTPQPARKRTRRRWTGAIAAQAVALALVAGIAVVIASRSHGSASPGVAHVGATPTTTGRSSSQSGTSVMRSHGVPDFPDPSSQGEVQIKGGPHGDLDPNSPQFKVAQQAYASFMPGPGGGPGRGQ